MRAIWNINGLPDSGKSSFCLTGPKPLLCFIMDSGFNLAYKNHIQRYPEDKDRIFTVNLIKECYDMRISDAENNLKHTSLVLWNRIKSETEKFLKSGNKTLMPDQGTTLWEILRYSKFGYEKVIPADYAICNRPMNEYLQQFSLFDKTILFPHRMTENWISASKTNGYKRDGYKHSNYEVDVEISLHKKEVEAVNGIPYMARWIEFPKVGGIGKCKPNDLMLLNRFELDGQVINGICNMYDDNGNLTWEQATYFPNLASLLYGNSPEDWK